MDRIWLKSYPDNFVSDISQNKHNSIIDLMNEATERFSKNKAFSNLNSQLTFHETKKFSEKFGGFLQHKLVIKKSTNIAIMLPNLLSYPVAIFGSFIAGGIVVNVNPLFKQREILNVLIDSEAEIIIVLDRFLEELEPIINQTKLKHIIVCDVTDLLNPLMKFVVKVALTIKGPKIKRLKSTYIKFSDAIKYEKKPNKILLNREDIALLQYTGGTTGKSKAAVLTHGNLLSNIEQLNIWIGKSIEIGKESIITALPLYHIFSLTVNLFYFFSIGSKNILITNPRDLKSFIKTLRTNKFTVITAVNTLFNLLLSSSSFKKIDFKYLKFSVGGGMAVLNNTAQRWKKITKTNITQGYGLTETSPVISVNIISDEYNGTIGLPLPSTDISLRDDKGDEIGIDEVGELCVKGPQVMKNYWNNKNETKNAFTEDGFFKTGDIASIDKNGYIKIVDRKKDMIISSGFNVYPNEIEDYVATHSDVLECGVIGIPDINRGESIKLFVVTSNVNLKENDILSFCKEGLTVYKIPKKIEFIDELPKNNVGKILRRKLRELK